MAIYGIHVCVSAHVHRQIQSVFQWLPWNHLEKKHSSILPLCPMKESWIYQKNHQIYVHMQGNVCKFCGSYTCTRDGQMRPPGPLAAPAINLSAPAAWDERLTSRRSWTHCATASVCDRDCMHCASARASAYASVRTSSQFSSPRLFFWMQTRLVATCRAKIVPPQGLPLALSPRS